MIQEDIQKALEALGKGGITIQGDFVMSKQVEYEVNGVEDGGIGIQIINNHKEEIPLTVADKNIKEALEELQNAKDEQDKYILFDFDQWYAVFRVLSQFCGYPQKPKDFDKTMKNIGADKMRVPCKYENYRKVVLNKLPQNVALWKHYLNMADQYSLKQIKVAMKLMDILHLE